VPDATPPEWDDPLPTLEGRAWSFGLRLDAEHVLAARCAALHPAEACAHLFADVDGSIAAQIADGDVVVAEEYGGDPSLVRPAVAALAAAGVQALVGRTIRSDLATAAIDSGLVVLRLDTPCFAHTGDRLRLDLDAAKVVNLSSGDRAPIRNLDDAERAQLRRMLARHRSTR
jgi:3-isopropylmalate dehydratase small subunit